MGKGEWKKMNEHCKRVQELFHTKEDHAFNINLRVWFVKPFVFTNIDRVKNRFF